MGRGAWPVHGSGWIAVSLSGGGGALITKHLDSPRCTPYPMPPDPDNIQTHAVHK